MKSSRRTHARFDLLNVLISTRASKRDILRGAARAFRCESLCANNYQNKNLGTDPNVARANTQPALWFGCVFTVLSFAVLDLPFLDFVMNRISVLK